MNTALSSFGRVLTALSASKTKKTSGFHKSLILLLMLSFFGNAWGQTNPVAQTLPYTQDFSSFTGSSTTYPSGWQGWNLTGSLSNNFPTVAGQNDRALTSTSNTTTAVHIGDMNGKMGIYNSGSSLATPCLAINTSGATGIQVIYKAGTQRTENTRLNELGLQYRVGTSGTFTDVSGTVYQNQLTPTNTSGTAAVNVKVMTYTLPSAAENKPVVQLRWVIRTYSGSGAHPGFSIDDISITAATSCASPINLTTGTVTQNSAVLGWTAPALSPAGGYDYYYSTTNTVPTATTTPSGNVSGLSVTQSSLLSNTTYYWWIRSHCSDSDLGNWISGGIFTTNQIPATLEYTDGFEGTNSWSFVNGSATNKWYVGTATSNGGTKSLYISNDNSTSNLYTVGSPGSVYAYRDITIPAASTTIKLSFDYKVVGENGYDMFRVWLVPASYTPISSTTNTPSVITASSGRIQVGGNFQAQNSYISYVNNSVDVSSFAGQTMRLIFEWQNDNLYGTNPPAAIDNINLALPGPNTTISPNTLTGFAATTASDSAPQSFKVSGALLGTSPIVVRPPAGYEISLTSASGYSSADISLTPTSGTVAPTDIYVILKKNAVTGSVNGGINVHSDAVSPDKTVTLAGSINKATFTSAGNGNWETPGTWDLNTVPGADDNVVINAAHTVTATTAKTRNAGSTTTVTGTLATNATYTNNGTTTINGSFQINAGGWATGNDFIFGASSTLIFNHSDNNVYGPIDGNHKYWPSAGPFNVKINANSPIDLGVQRTVNGVLESSATINNPGNITIGTNGTMKLSAGYGWSGTGSPIYGTASLLQYNSAGSPGRGAEWTQSAGTVGTTAGLPQNVQISNNTILNFPNGSGGTFKANGNLTIDSGSSLYQNYSGGSAGLLVGGNLTLDGALGLGSNVGGDITVGGNWTQAAAATFQPNGRAAIFNGTLAQTIQKTGGGTIDFDYLQIDKTNATNVSLSNVAGNLTDININGTSGNIFALTGAGAGTLNITGRALNFNNNGGNIYVDAAKSLIATAAASVNFNGSKVVANNAGTGTLLFPANVTINLNANGIVDFGFSATSISTVSGVLKINSTTNCYVNANAPIYVANSKLVYNSTGTYGRNVEWSATSGAGYPYEVQVTNNTTLNYPNTAGAFATNLGIVTNLTIDLGSAVYMDYGGGNNKSGNLTIGGNLVNSGSLSLGNAIGGDLYLAGNWTSSTNFTPNNRAVVFNGNNNDQNINSATTFDYLTVNKTLTGNLYLSASIIVNKDLTLTNKSISLTTFNLTLPNKTSVITSNANSYINAGGTGKLIRQNIDGTSDWVFPMGVALAGRYAPITFKNLSGATEIGVRVSTTLSPAVADATKTLKTEWFASTTNNVTANVYAEWQAAEQGASMTVPTTGDLGVAIGTNPYTVYDVNLVASNTQANGVVLSNTAANGIVIGNDEAISLSNDECNGAKEVIVDAAAITGATKGASQSLVPTCGGGTAIDVWYKFTTTDAATYRIDVTGSSSFDSVLELRSGSCTGTSINCVDASGSGSNETISASLLANTTYYYRVYPYSNPTTYTFTTSVTTIPTLIVNPTSLDFGGVPFNTDSANQTFTVKGSFLNPSAGNISLSAVPGYQYSLDGVTDWQTILSLPYTGKKLNETTVYVKLHPTAACTDYNGAVAISGGGAASVNLAVTGKGIVQAPIANSVAAADITATTFLASWNTVPNATGYVIEVSTSPTFGSGTTGSISETFESGNVPSAYPATETEYTLDGGRKWKIYRGNDSGAVYAGTKSLALSNNTTNPNTPGYIISPSITGITTVELYAMRNGFGSATAPLYVYKTVGSTTTQVLPQIDMNASNYGGYKKFTINVNESSPATIKIINGTSNLANIDNIVISYDQFIPDFVAPYQNYSVGNVTSFLVDQNLQANTQYYYRVRAVNASCQSPNSNVIPVMTNDTVVWNGTAWSNVSGPTATLNAKIIGAFVTGAAPQNDFTAKKLTIDTGGSLQITANHAITVVNELVNNLSVDKVVIEDGANLLQVTDSPPVVNSGSVRVEKLFTFTTPAEPTPNRQQYNYVSSPVIGGNLKDIYPGSPAALYHNQATNTFFTSSGANIIGRALALKEPSVTAVPAQTVTAAFSGVPFNGTLNYPLAYTTANASVSPGFNLVGNPYPSNIDLELLYEANQSNIEASFWFWDNRGNTEFKQLGSAYTGDNYAKYNAVSGTGVGIGYKAPNSPEDALRQPNKFVKVGTGFMVRALTGRNGQNLIFNNTMRSADNSGPSFFGKESLKDRYWLNMKTPAAMEFSNAVVYFDGGNQAFGPEDTRTFNSSDGIYTLVDEHKLAINGKSKFEVTDKVNLGLNMFASGNYTISLGEREGIFANGQNIYLKDKQTGTVTNLSEGSYSFMANAGETTGRFEIIYQPETILGTDGSAKDEVKVYRDGQEFVINSSTKKITGVEVYDTSGKLILKCSTNQSEVRLDGSHWINGVYVLKIHRNGQITTKKVVK